MAGVSAHTLTLWEYQALVWNWNDRHGESAGSSMPDPDAARRAMSVIANRTVQ